MLGLGVSSASQLGGTAFALENSILAAFKTRVLADSGVVEDYACLNLDVKDLITEPAPFTTGLLEFYPGAAAAYSLRQLRRSVSPYAIRVRRSSDSQEQDIGFNSNGELDTNALLDFAEGGDAFVSVWYDQSSNGNDATQTSTASQPKIVSSGSVVTENGKPAIYSGTGRAWLGTGQISYSSSFISAAFSRISRKGANDSVYLFQGLPYNQLYSNSSNWQYFSTTTGYDTGLSLTNNQQLISVEDTGAATTYYKNGTAGNTHSISNNVVNKTFELFYQPAANYGTEGNFQELVLWDSDQSSNRTGIESNINEYYSIY